ncbi:MAG: hypothetical protein QF362_04135 [Candidatus Woesearchaeota archaeon]|jgi:hypothetical protein|nr:hypothetical protein [Candidatus Woesearchaeota archaeon]MDP7506604.1 hypothetical protein [Candidatus Woesearchaeota archaeon]MDP7610259.1 hypothetical protein [Candidatus Woesearchaeota archaeon]|tara:strand:- start:287 stop:847 length:561 start_codon:yes stop_codon:yes gene_type:complete
MDRKQIKLFKIRPQRFDDIKNDRKKAGEPSFILNNTLNHLGVRNYCLIKKTIGFKDMPEFYNNIEGELKRSLFHSIEFSGIKEIIRPGEALEYIQDLFSSSESADKSTVIRIKYCSPNHSLRRRDQLVFKWKDDIIRCEEAFIGHNNLGDYSTELNLEGERSPALAVYLDKLPDFIQAIIDDPSIR